MTYIGEVWEPLCWGIIACKHLIYFRPDLFCTQANNLVKMKVKMKNECNKSNKAMRNSLVTSQDQPQKWWLILKMIHRPMVLVTESSFHPDEICLTMPGFKPATPPANKGQTLLPLCYPAIVVCLHFILHKYLYSILRGSSRK